MVCVFCYTFRQYGYLPLIFVRSDIYQLKSAMRKNVFSYSKTGSASVSLDIKNYRSTFHFVTLSDKIDCGRKYEEQKNAYWTQKNRNNRNRRMQICSSLLKLRNKISGHSKWCHRGRWKRAVPKISDKKWHRGKKVDVNSDTTTKKNMYKFLFFACSWPGCSFASSIGLSPRAQAK